MEYNHSQYVIEAIKQVVIPQVRTYTRYGTGSVVMFDYAESPLCPAGRFRISELTSNVPYAVRSTLRNDSRKQDSNYD